MLATGVGRDLSYHTYFVFVCLGLGLEEINTDKSRRKMYVYLISDHNAIKVDQTPTVIPEALEIVERGEDMWLR